jgi:diaminohydroxyphosphoribosylaminopyrimidine deaminase / 5-amino-6-(5-phosphoribosylamino)uracil reductase
MQAALALAVRAQGQTAPNPNVGCVIVAEGRVIARGQTQAGGRPHAEAVALSMAGAAARGATLYTTLEPCAHHSARGPACADLIPSSGVARVVSAMRDPDPRTDGRGHDRLSAAGIAVTTSVCALQAQAAMAGFLMRQRHGRPFVTLKLALSIDGALALADGCSRWITGPHARAHAHLERARHDAIVIGRGTFTADAPELDVRLPGLESRRPQRWLLSVDPAIAAGAPGWRHLAAPAAIGAMTGDYLLVEGGAGAAAAFLAADLVDRLLIYRAPIVIGGGRGGVDAIGLNDLAVAHGRWVQADSRTFGADQLTIYHRNRG